MCVITLAILIFLIAVITTVVLYYDRTLFGIDECLICFSFMIIILIGIAAFVVLIKMIILYFCKLCSFFSIASLEKNIAFFNSKMRSN